MGRSNVCTHRECEGLYYLDRDYLDTYCKVTKDKRGKIASREIDTAKTVRELRNAGIASCSNGFLNDWAYDDYLSSAEWSDMVSYMKLSLMKRFKSFFEVDRLCGDRHIILRNGLFEIAVVDNEWSVAWCLLEREDTDNNDRNRTLMRILRQSSESSLRDGARPSVMVGLGYMAKHTDWRM